MSAAAGIRSLPLAACALVLKGRDFSPAEECCNDVPALAAEGTLVPDRSLQESSELARADTLKV